MRALKSSKRAGYSMIEMLLGLTILGALSSSAILATNGGIGSFESARTSEVVQTSLHRSANRIVRELMPSGVSVLGPAGLSDEYGSDSIIFQTPTDMNASGPVWGPTQTITLEYSAGELDDGIDNDGNGLVDECVVVLTRNAGLASAQRVVLCSNVREVFVGEVAGNLNDDNGNGIRDEGGFNASLDGEVLTIRICVEVPSFDGNSVIRQITTSVDMRN